MPLRHSRHGNFCGSFFSLCAGEEKSSCWFSWLPVISSNWMTEGAVLVSTAVGWAWAGSASFLKQIQPALPQRLFTFSSSSSPNCARYFLVAASKISWIFCSPYFSLGSLAAQNASAAVTSTLPKSRIRDCGFMLSTRALQDPWKNRNKSSNFCR